MKNQHLRAILLGQRLDTRGLEHQHSIGLSLLTVRAGAEGVAFLFRYGVAVIAGSSPEEEAGLLDRLQLRVADPLSTPEVDQVSFTLKPGGEDHIDPSGGLVLSDISTERLQVVAHVLSKSVALAHYEAQIAAAFDRVEPLAAAIKVKGHVPREGRRLIEHIGDVMVAQHRMVGRVAVEDKPDVLWELPQLERLYARLADEYELLERSRAVDRKLALVGETVRTLVDLAQDQRSVRLEWYIIALIAIELLISIYHLFMGT